MTKRGIQIHVGTAEDMGRRFVDAWRRAARGERVREEHLTFVDFKQMLGTLSDERLRLLKEVRREEAASVRLGVSRPFLIRVLEAGQIPFRKVGQLPPIRMQSLLSQVGSVHRDECQSAPE